MFLFLFSRTLPRIHSHKSASLPARGKDTDSPPVLDVLRVLPEDLATQITRMDFPVFKCVPMFNDYPKLWGSNSNNKIKLALSIAIYSHYDLENDKLVIAVFATYIVWKLMCICRCKFHILFLLLQINHTGRTHVLWMD